MKTNQKGFSLIELLVVVIIIGIIAAIAIPSLLASRRAANEAAAVSALRTIGSAQATYQATKGSGNNYTTLTNLGTEKLIDSTLAGGTKGAYTFADTGTPTLEYCIKASAVDDALREYAMATDGVIKVNVGNVATGAVPTCAADFTTTGAVLGN